MDVFETIVNRRTTNTAFVDKKVTPTKKKAAPR